MVIEKYETAKDSGGAGLHRGGNGIVMSYRFLEAGEIAIHDDRWFVPAWGVNNGLPGKRARKILEKPDGTKTVLPNKIEEMKVEADDILHFITWGGGGWGDPLDRDPELVGKEIRQNLVSVEGARDYGVVADQNGKIDTNATEALRAQIRKARGADQLFNFGRDIEELRARCEDETGLPAPRQPIWIDTEDAASLAAE